jgi:hypothetical protein
VIEDAEIRGPIRLRLIEHVGFPLWDREDFLGDDYDELHAWLGLTRASYDALWAWQRQFDALEPGDRRALAALRAPGEQLRARLTAEFGGRWDVELEDVRSVPLRRRIGSWLRR